MIRPINDGFKHQMEREVIAGFLNMCFQKAGLASGTTSGNITLTSNAVSGFAYTIGGVFYSTVSAPHSFTPVVGSVGMSTVASDKARLYAICLTSNGSMVLWAGDQVSAGSANVTAFCNTAPASQCIIGTLLISNASTTSWAVGSNVGSTNNVLTDCFMVPQGVIINV